MEEKKKCLSNFEYLYWWKWRFAAKEFRWKWVWHCGLECQFSSFLCIDWKNLHFWFCPGFWSDQLINVFLRNCKMFYNFCNYSSLHCWKDQDFTKFLVYMTMTCFVNIKMLRRWFWFFWNWNTLKKHNWVICKNSFLWGRL